MGPRYGSSSTSSTNTVHLPPQAPGGPETEAEAEAEPAGAEAEVEAEAAGDGDEGERRRRHWLLRLNLAKSLKVINRLPL